MQNDEYNKEMESKANIKDSENFTNEKTTDDVMYVSSTFPEVNFVPFTFQAK